MRAAVVVFPGSNCDRDCAVAIEHATGVRSAMVWHGENELPNRLDLIVLPGGFAHGDYLRTGAMAALSPIMSDVRAQAARGVAVLGICNGFQVLCEAGMLPGALLRNAGLKYVCRSVALQVANADTRFTSAFGARQEASMPVGNGEGNYHADAETLDRLEGAGRVAIRYRDNPNGSARDIAGIVDHAGNVMGLMPHPDRAFDASLSAGSADGALVFQSVLGRA